MVDAPAPVAATAVGVLTEGRAAEPVDPAAVVVPATEVPGVGTRVLAPEVPPVVPVAGVTVGLVPADAVVPETEVGDVPLVPVVPLVPGVVPLVPVVPEAPPVPEVVPLMLEPVMLGPVMLEPVVLEFVPVVLEPDVLDGVVATFDWTAGWQPVDVPELAVLEPDVPVDEGPVLMVDGQVVVPGGLVLEEDDGLVLVCEALVCDD